MKELFSLSRLRSVIFFILTLPLLLWLLKALWEALPRAGVARDSAAPSGLPDRSQDFWRRWSEEEVALERARRAMEKVKLHSYTFSTVADRAHPLSEVLWDAGYDMTRTDATTTRGGKHPCTSCTSS